MKIRINAGSQQLTLLDDAGRVAKRYAVSTAKSGLGENNGSYCTPRGRHVVRAKIGAGQPMGAVFVSRRPTGEIWTPELHAKFPGRDWMLTRLLWLSGCEPGFNRLRDVDTMRRMIISMAHRMTRRWQTRVARLLRMRNEDIAELFDLVPPYTAVEIEA